MAVAVCRSATIRSTPTPSRTSTPWRVQRPPGALAALRAHRREQPGRGLDEDHPDGANVERREVLRQDLREQLHHRPGRLDAGRPAAAEHDVQLAALDHRRVGGGPLEPLEDAMAELERVVERLERDGVLLDPVDAVVGGHRAGGERPASRSPTRRDRRRGRGSASCGRGRRPRPWPSARWRCAAGGTRRGRRRRRRRRRDRPSPPGTATAGTGGSCWRR